MYPCTHAALHLGHEISGIALILFPLRRRGGGDLLSRLAADERQRLPEEP